MEEQKSCVGRLLSGDLVIYRVIIEGGTGRTVHSPLLQKAHAPIITSAGKGIYVISPFTMKLPATAYSAEVATSATKAGSCGVFGEGEYLSLPTTAQKK